jgi:hypothetical protein
MRKSDQETPQQQKQEAEKPGTKASAGDLAKATQNPVASLISVPLSNVANFNIGPFARDRNSVIQAQPVIPISPGERQLERSQRQRLFASRGWWHRKNHAIGLSASKRQRPGLQCQASGQSGVSHLAVEVPNCIFVSKESQGIVPIRCRWSTRVSVVSHTT